MRAGHIPRSSSGAIQALVLIGLVAYALGAALIAALDVPIVYVSRATGECVRVEAPPEQQGKFSCRSLPEKYERVWVSGNYLPAPRD